MIRQRVQAESVIHEHVVKLTERAPVEVCCLESKDVDDVGELQKVQTVEVPPSGSQEEEIQDEQRSSGIQMGCTPSAMVLAGRGTSRTRRRSQTATCRPVTGTS